MVADLLVLVGLAADLVGFFGFTGAALHQPHGGQNVEEELEELRLPVFGDVDGEVGAGEVVQVGHRLLPVGQLLIVELGSTGPRLADQGEQQDGAEEQGEAVPAQEASHRLSSVSAVQQPDDDHVGEPDGDEAEYSDEHSAHVSLSGRSRTADRAAAYSRLR